jgi:hypothetical protein
MTRYKLAFLILMGMTLSYLFTSCAANENLTTPGTTEATEAVNMLSPTSVSSLAGSPIRISGDATLPNGTKLQSQLWVGSQPILWWPKDKDIEVINGQWEITIPFSINGAPYELPQGPVYNIVVWVKDRPEFEGSMLFGFNP